MNVVCVVFKSSTGFVAELLSDVFVVDGKLVVMFNIGFLADGYAVGEFVGGGVGFLW